MIYSYELEKQLLAGLLKDPQSLIEISSFISHKDFYSETSLLHATIFRIIKQSIDAGEEVDNIILAQRVNEVGLSFEGNVNPADYIKSLSMRAVPSGNLIKTSKELKKYSIRREIVESSELIVKKMKGMAPESSYIDIIETADQIYNSRINLFDIGNNVPENIYDDMILIPRKEFLDVLRYIYKKKHDFMYLSLQEEDTKQIHKGFNQLLISSPNIADFSLDEE